MLHLLYIEVIIMIGKNLNSALKNGYTNNIIGFIYKPIDTEEMITIVKETLYRKNL